MTVEPHPPLRWPALGDLRRALDSRQQTSVALVRACLDRIRAVDPLVHAIIAVDETALDAAADADRRPAAGPLHGIPVLVKDNIDTAGLASTAGSRLLAGAPPARDADVVARLRAAGAIVLGKTNLSEWANMRSVDGIEGWSAVGGQTRNPHRLDHSPWGSSAGSAVAVATGMAPLAIGTETDGSIVCPAAVNGVVGLTPAHGLLPLDGVVPVSPEQDRIGVLATRVRDAAICLDALAGGLLGEPVSLRGRRFGRWRLPGMPESTERVVDEVAAGVTAAGGVVVPVEPELDVRMLDDGLRASIAEFRPGLEAYLRTRSGVPASLPELIAANRADPVELGRFGQDLFERAAAVSTADRMVGRVLRERSRQRARAVLADVLAAHRLDAVLAATCPPPWRLDQVRGDVPARASSTLAALAGYPVVSVPAGFADGSPVAVSVFGLAETGPVARLADAIENAACRYRSPDLRTEFEYGVSKTVTARIG